MLTAGQRHPVFLHGFSGSSASWGDELVDGLTGAGLTPVLVDLPGHGREAGEHDPGRFTLAAALERVEATGGWPTDLVGYSMGGRIALHFARAHPEKVRRLVLESSSPGLAAESERAERRSADEALASRLLDDGVEWFSDYWESLPIFASRAGLDGRVLSRLRSIRLSNDPASLAAALRGLGTGSLPSLWRALPAITTPTLLVVGASDPKYVDVARRMAAAMPNSTVVEVPDAGHSVHLERPDAWLSAVASFLADA